MDFKPLAKRETNPHYKAIFELIAEAQPSAKKGVLDSSPVEYSHTASQIDAIKGKLYSEVKTAYTRDGEKFMGLEEAKKAVKDDFFNLFTGNGTSQDTGTYNAANVPMMMGPWDSTALYSSGGIPQTIIDKKVNGVYSAPTHFAHKDWDRQELDDLGAYADSLGFRKEGSVALQDSLIYGGASLIPAFNFDNPLTYELPFNVLESMKMIQKDSLSYFWTADRWNTVVVPNWNISVRDYLTPERFYIPIAGKNVHTSRMAVVKVKQLPYWAAIRQLGWCTSDMIGYTVSSLAYNMAVQAINMMCQQSSLLYTHIPLDGMLLQNGPDDVEQFITKNNEALRQWSIMNPKTFNSFGEVKILDRQYGGFDTLVMMLRQDIAARADLPESDIFSTQAKGFSDNTNEVTIKKAQVFETIGDRIAPAYKNVTRALVLSCFGPDSPQAKKPTPQLVFNHPIVQSNDEKMKSGAVFFGMMKDGFDMGMKPGIALQLAKQFAPELDIPADLQKEIEAIEIPKEEPKSDESAGNKAFNSRAKVGGGEDAK